MLIEIYMKKSLRYISMWGTRIITSRDT